MSLKITVEDEQTGDTETGRLAEGDYFLTTHEPCYLDGIQTYANGTVVLTIKGHSPKPLSPAPQAERGEGTRPVTFRIKLVINGNGRVTATAREMGAEVTTGADVPTVDEFLFWLRAQIENAQQSESEEG